MEIDLNKIPLGIAESQREVTILKSGVLYKEITNIKNKTDYNKLTISMPVYNVLISHDKFLHNYNIDYFDSSREIGLFCGYKVFLDLSLQENIILVSYDVCEKRDDIISSILENSEIKKDLKIKVLNC